MGKDLSVHSLMLEAWVPGAYPRGGMCHCVVLFKLGGRKYASLALCKMLPSVGIQRQEPSPGNRCFNGIYIK